MTACEVVSVSIAPLFNNLPLKALTLTKKMEFGKIEVLLINALHSNIDQKLLFVPDRLIKLLYFK